MWIRSAFSALTRTSGTQRLVAVLVALVVGGAVFMFTRPGPSGPLLSPSGSPDPLNNSEIRAILLPDAIAAVDNPSFVAANRAGMRDNLSVIGVELGGEAHAFPIAFMSRVEIVNDRIGGKNIAVTW